MLLGGIANSAPVITSSSTAEAATKVKTKKKTTKNQIPTASIFIYINQNDPNYQTVQDAIKAWNATKVIKFKQVFNYQKAQIIVTAHDYGDTSWAGLTEMPDTPRGYLYGSVVYLNNFYFRQSTPQVALSVAEHELGHAISQPLKQFIMKNNF